MKIRPEELQKFEIRRQSIDARKKPELYYVYSIDVQVKKEKEVLKKHPKNVQKTQDVYYQMPKLEGETPKKRPVVVGSGPAGLFCAWILALAGCRPILLERGVCVEERQRDVEEFWKSGILIQCRMYSSEREAPELFRMESSTHWSKIHPGEIVLCWKPL